MPARSRQGLRFLKIPTISDDVRKQPAYFQNGDILLLCVFMMFPFGNLHHFSGWKYRCGHDREGHHRYKEDVLGSVGVKRAGGARIAAGAD
jgi:hypothetical protein